MQDFHRTSTTWLDRRTGRGSTARSTHRSRRRRLALEPLESRALLSLTTWTVNSLGDTGAGSGTSGDLRYVITQADKTPGNNSINFSVTGKITLNSALPDLSNTTGVMDIDGPGASRLTMAPVAGSYFYYSVFTVNTGVTATLTGLAISGGLTGQGGGITNEGTTTVTNCSIDNNVGYNNGGGVFNDGMMTIINSTIDNNSSNGNAGGIANAGTMTLIDSSISGNSVTGISSALGGGIESTGTLTITGCIISGNQANGGTGFQPGQAAGGGIWANGFLQVSDSTISGNSATGGGNVALYGGRPVFPGPAGSASGGGLYLLGTASITNVTISGNNAEGGPGGGSVNYIYFVGYEFIGYDGGSAEGGGLQINGGPLMLTNCTISGNTASGGNGGIGEQYLAPSGQDGQGGSADAGGIGGLAFPATIVNCTVTSNSASGGVGGGSWSNNNFLPDTQASSNAGGIDATAENGTGGALTISNSIVALNRIPGGFANDIVGTVTSASAYNLIGTGGSGGLVNGVNGNQVGVATRGSTGLRTTVDRPRPSRLWLAARPSTRVARSGRRSSQRSALTTDERGTGFRAHRQRHGGHRRLRSSQLAHGGRRRLGDANAALQTASDGLRLLPAGRTTDMPWLGIDQVASYPEPSRDAGGRRHHGD